MSTEDYELRNRIEAVENAESDDNELPTFVVPTDFEDGARFHEEWRGRGAAPVSGRVSGPAGRNRLGAMLRSS